MLGCLWYWRVGVSFAVLVALCCLLPGGALAEGKPDTVLARFMAEAPARWQAVDAADQAPGTVKVSKVMKIFIKNKLQSTEETSAIAKRATDQYLFRFTRNGQELVFGRNPQYSFGIVKRPGKGGWSLAEHAMRNAKEDSTSDDLVEFLAPNGHGFITILGPVSKLFKDTRFKTLRAEETASGKIRVHFEALVAAPGLEIRLNGWMDFDPKNSMVLEASEFKSSNGALVTMNKSFSTSASNYRPCTSWRTTSDDGEWRRDEEVTFEVLDSNAADESEFYISAFGLPEPVGVTVPQRTHWWLWFGGASAGVLCVGSLLFLLKRRYFSATARSVATAEAKEGGS